MASIWRIQPSNRLRSFDLHKQADDKFSYNIALEFFGGILGNLLTVTVFSSQISSSTNNQIIGIELLKSMLSLISLHSLIIRDIDTSKVEVS